MSEAAAQTHTDPDYPITPVPRHARRGVFSLLMVLLGFTFFVPTMLAGAQVGEAFSFGQFLGILVAGSLVLGIYVAILGAIGARTGLTTVLMSRYALGRVGAKGASLLLGGTQVGWYGVAAASLANLAARAFGWDSAVATRLLMVAGGVLMGVTAYYGFKGMYWLSVVSIPPMFALAFWVVARSLGEVGGWSGLAAGEGSGALPVTAAITIVVGTFASGGTQAPNWTRFGRTGTQAFVAALVAFLVGNGLLLFFGGVGAIAFNEGDFTLILYELGLVVWGLLLLLGALWTTNDNAAYAFAVAGAEIFDRPDKRPFVVGGVAIAILLAVTGIYNWLPTYLLWLGIIIPPLGGVIIGDWLRTWRNGIPHTSTYEFARVRPGNVAAYIGGAAIAWASSELQWGVAAVNGVLAALVGVWIFGALLRDRPGGPAQKPT